MVQILKFHTGRGGRFYNSGFVTFVGIEKITEGATLQDLFEMEDGSFQDAAGNEVDAVINEDGTGYVNEDGDYDTTTCVFEYDLNDKQVEAISMEVDNPYYGDDLKRILETYGYDT